MTAASHAAGPEFNSRLEYLFFCIFAPEGAQLSEVFLQPVLLSYIFLSWKFSFFFLWRLQALCDCSSCSCIIFIGVFCCCSLLCDVFFFCFYGVCVRSLPKARVRLGPNKNFEAPVLARLRQDSTQDRLKKNGAFTNSLSNLS